MLIVAHRYKRRSSYSEPDTADEPAMQPAELLFQKCSDGRLNSLSKHPVEEPLPTAIFQSLQLADFAFARRVQCLKLMTDDAALRHVFPKFNGAKGSNITLKWLNVCKITYWRVFIDFLPVETRASVRQRLSPP